jgi:hypothetical protein
MADEALALTWQALQFKPWPDDRLSALQSEWESADFFTNLPDAMGLNGAEDADLCQRAAKIPLSGIFPLSELAWEIRQSPPSAYGDLKYDLQELHYSQNDALKDEKNLLLYSRDRELELQHAIQSPSWAQMRSLPGITNSNPFKYSAPFLTAMISDHGRPMPQLAASAAMAEAERRILITAIALERYRGKYGSYPNSLAQLSPEFLKAVPLDFMDGQPLRYRPTADGHFLLYSVGLDCVDDGGKPPEPDAPRFGSFEHGTFIVPTNADIVWPVPASP